MIFADFDFGALDLPSYGEDAVREDIIAPILRKLGYAATGSARMERSKKLIHPFVKIGSKDHPIYIIPDYILYWEQTPLLVLEAKSPAEEVAKSKHAEQAFSYAVHPDIRVPVYALCNGRHLIVSHVSSWAPILSIPVNEIDGRWEEVKKALAPQFLLQPELRNFQADYGMTLLKSGASKDALIIVPEAYWQIICKVKDGLYTACAGCMHGDVDCLMSFDFDETTLARILQPLPAFIASKITLGLTHQPYNVELDGKLIVGCVGDLGQPTSGLHDEFVPIMIKKITKSIYDPTIVLSDPE